LSHGSEQFIWYFAPALEVFYGFGNILGVEAPDRNPGIGDSGNGMVKKHEFHENLRREHAIKTASNRSFGLVFAVVFALLALAPLIGGNLPNWWLAAIAAAFLGAALLVPSILRPLNIVWQKFGAILHAIVNPLTMGILFYVTVTPTALIMRAFGKVPLHLKFDSKADTYWIERDPPGPEPKSMNRQF